MELNRGNGSGVILTQSEAQRKDLSSPQTVGASGEMLHSVQHDVSQAGEANVTIFTDGACSGNPGPGGWGAILRYGTTEKELFGGEAQTTNNRMEMMAAIQALSSLSRPCTVTLYTDSQYLRQGITEWIKGWKARGWRTADKSPVKNVDLWQQLDALNAMHRIDWQWVKGHAGHPENERADALARQGVPS